MVSALDNGGVSMVAGTGDKKVDWQLISNVAEDLGGSGKYGLIEQWDDVLKSFDEVNIEHGAWSRIGQMMMSGPYDSVVQETRVNLTKGREMLTLIAKGLEQTAKVWEACEGQNIDNLTPSYAPPYNNAAGKVD
jgi:hypothetical protein